MYVTPRDLINNSWALSPSLYPSPKSVFISSPPSFFPLLRYLIPLPFSYPSPSLFYSKDSFPWNRRGICKPRGFRSGHTSSWVPGFHKERPKWKWGHDFPFLKGDIYLGVICLRILLTSQINHCRCTGRSLMIKEGKIQLCVFKLAQALFIPSIKAKLHSMRINHLDQEW